MTTETTSRAGLYRKIAAVAGAIEAVEKDARNKDQGYRYASPAGVMSAVKPLMQAQELAIVPHLVEFIEIDSGQKAGSGKPFIINRVTMHYHILDGESGEEMVVPWQGQAGTYGDDKGLAKAQTIALRTFLIQLFQIPAEDSDADPDARDARPMQHPQRQQARPATNGASYHPPVEEPAPPAKNPPTKERVIKRIRALWAEERDLGGQAPAAELATDLETLSLEQLIAAGKKLASRVEGLKAAKDLAPQRGVTEASLPESLPDVRQHVAA